MEDERKLAEGGAQPKGTPRGLPLGGEEPPRVGKAPGPQLKTSYSRIGWGTSSPRDRAAQLQLLFSTGRAGHAIDLLKRSIEDLRSQAQARSGRGRA